VQEKIEIVLRPSRHLLLPGRNGLVAGKGIRSEEDKKDSKRDGQPADANP